MTRQTRRFEMAQWDVFTSEPLKGNSLAIFFDARGLSDAEMQALAKEMNLSETTFILPENENAAQKNGVRVRIFTVEEELPFAGHPTLGTAFALRGNASIKEIVLNLSAGRVPVRFEDPPGQPAFGEMKQVDPIFGMRHSYEDVATATGLKLADFDTDLPIQTVSTGLPFTIAPLRSLAIIRNLRIDLTRATSYLEKTGGKFFYFVSRETVDPAARLHARMFFYNGEDPATGSAAGCTSAWMVRNGVAQSDERVLIEQGVEIERPSRIFVRATGESNLVINVRVGGNAVEVMRGEVFL